MISREVEAAALKGTRVSSQEISLFTPGPKAATRHHDQADPPYSRRNWSWMHNQSEKPAGHVIGGDESGENAPNCRVDWPVRTALRLQKQTKQNKNPTNQWCNDMPGLCRSHKVLCAQTCHGRAACLRKEPRTNSIFQQGAGRRGSPQ